MSQTSTSDVQRRNELLTMARAHLAALGGQRKDANYIVGDDNVIICEHTSAKQASRYQDVLGVPGHPFVSMVTCYLFQRN